MSCSHREFGVEISAKRYQGYFRIILVVLIGRRMLAVHLSIVTLFRGVLKKIVTVLAHCLKFLIHENSVGICRWNVSWQNTEMVCIWCLINNQYIIDSCNCLNPFSFCRCIEILRIHSNTYIQKLQIY